nr:ISPps1 family transposase [uncultured bacterium]
MSATSKPKLYNPRHPERTLLYQTVAEHYETWLELASAGQFDGQGDHHTPKPFQVFLAKLFLAAKNGLQ